MTFLKGLATALATICREVALEESFKRVDLMEDLVEDFLDLIEQRSVPCVNER